ncbi:MAG TPA: serine/threonine-protein kinase [Streptosporangiaceae bacterium]|jgi:serine/threonine-protein kinase|nr:serine/threonine-protein kinase [Streptosporangiaceae bacterium]
MSLSLNAEVLASRYRLDELIASGGMGSVWRAVDLVLDRPVAVKLLRDELAQHPDTIARFRAEARHAAGLSHPAIAQVYDFGEASGDKPAFIVMELIDGPPLTALIADGALPPDQVLDILAQVAGGLAVAHAAGVVHRDIKPGNILIDRAGLVKITDFGVAYAAGSVPLTRTGTLLGTPAYLAPERVAGKAAGPASDLYSLGMVAYESLTGQVPFTGTAMEIALAHRLQSLPPLPAGVPPELSKLIADLTARDPARRPASAGEVAARASALRDALRAGAIGPAAGGPGGSASSFAAGGAAAPDATTEFSATAAWQLAGPDEYGQGTWPAGPGTGRPRRSGFLVAAVIALALVAGLGGWVIANLAGAGSQPTQPPASHSSAPSARTVTVNAAALTGRPVREVASLLQQRGLHVTLSWQPTEGARPGTVIGVSPSGPVPVGTTVAITGASRGHHDHGHGHDGHGGGNGQGGD